MRWTAFLAVLLSAMCFQGCVSSGDTARMNIEKSKNLRLSMTKAEVLKTMGEPIRNETFCKPDVWYYFTGQVWADGLVSEDECLPLVFEKGKLIGWGKSFLFRHRMTVKKENKVVPAAVKTEKK